MPSQASRSRSRRVIQQSSESAGPVSTPKWSKTPSLTPEARRLVGEKVTVQETKHRLREEYSDEFESYGYFVWPKESSPSTMLGGSDTPLLDDIRYDYKCHIMFDPTKSFFKVAGSASAVVQAALVRIRNTFLQINARQFVPLQKRLVSWNDDEPAPPHVCIVENDQYKPQRTPYREGHAARHSSGSGDKQLLANAKQIKDTTMLALNRIRYYRGNITLRARLGTCLISKFEKLKNDECTLTEFEKMLLRPEYETNVTEEIGEPVFEANVLQNMKAATHLLNSMSQWEPSLEDVKPVYSAAITIKQTGGHLLRLSRQWQEDDDLFNVVSTRWERPDIGYDRPTQLLETHLIDLEDGLSWQLRMATTTPVDETKLDRSLRHLSDYYFNIIPEKAQKGNERWCDFETDHMGNARPVGGKTMLEQRIIWRFGLTNSAYTVEVAKIQLRTYQSTGVLGKEAETALEPRWSVSVVHRDWDISSAENSNLEIGKGATWRPDLGTWFPEDDGSETKNKGHISFLRKLIEIQKIVRIGAGRRRHQGMTVG